MSSCDAIKKSFKELVVDRPINKLTVSDICLKAGVSRKTFYLHFHDMNSVVEMIFRDEVLQPIRDVERALPVREIKSASQLILERMYQSIYENRLYYECILKYAGQNSFQDMAISTMTEMNMQVLKDCGLSKHETEYMAYFFAAAQTMFLIKWVSDKMVVPPKQMAKFFDKWGVRAFEEIFKK
jgi:AcrR family transcriptional regulator